MIKSSIVQFVFLVFFVACNSVDLYDENDYIEVKTEYKDNNIKEKALCHKDDTNRVLIKMFYNDVLRSKTFYFNGKKHGPVSLYQDNGTIMMDGFYKDNLKDSVHRIYDENGNLYITEKYNQGKEVGIWTFHDAETGKVISEERRDN